MILLRVSFQSCIDKLGPGACPDRLDYLNSSWWIMSGRLPRFGAKRFVVVDCKAPKEVADQMDQMRLWNRYLE